MHDHRRIVYPSQDSLKFIGSGQCAVDVLPSSKSHNVTATAKRERSGFLLFLGLESAISWTSMGLVDDILQGLPVNSILREKVSQLNADKAAVDEENAI